MYGQFPGYEKLKSTRRWKIAETSRAISRHALTAFLLFEEISAESAASDEALLISLMMLHLMRDAIDFIGHRCRLVKTTKSPEAPPCRQYRENRIYADMSQLHYDTNDAVIAYRWQRPMHGFRLFYYFHDYAR